MTSRPLPTRRFLAAALGLTAGIALLTIFAACGTGEPPAGTVAVSMYDNGYSPPVVRIPAGGRVLFRNLGRNQHHAVALDESWSTEASFGTLVMERGDAAEVTFERPGVYPYYCTYHGSPAGDRGMVGAVVVGDVEYEPSRGPARAPVSEPSGAVHRVPADYPRIQDAVDAAAPGDLVLVGPGVYRESVRITTPSIVLRGSDRNEVVLEGDALSGNGVLVLADGVAIENMTARNFQLNGFYWTGATGFSGSYLTAVNNGDYGVYAFDSTDGLIEHSYASGSPDAGFYVGQCYPCRTVLRKLVAENNALGYSGTNAGGELYLVDSVWRHNMAGIVPNTLDSELLPPQRETVIAGNHVYENGNLDAPAKPIAWPAFGNGILVAGGRDNLILRNLVTDHPGHGVLILASHDERFWPGSGNVVRENRVLRSRRADLAVGWPGTPGNCFADNSFASARPLFLERLRGCSGRRLPVGFDLGPAVAALSRRRAARAGDYPRGQVAAQPLPPPQPRMPGGADAPVRPAVGVFDGARPRLEEIELPREAASDDPPVAPAS